MEGNKVFISDVEALTSAIELYFCGLTEKVDKLRDANDPTRCDEDMLEFISLETGIEIPIETIPASRRLLQRSTRLFRTKGSFKGLADWIYQVTGYNSYIEMESTNTAASYASFEVDFDVETKIGTKATLEEEGWLWFFLVYFSDGTSEVHSLDELVFSATTPAGGTIITLLSGDDFSGEISDSTKGLFFGGIKEIKTNTRYNMYATENTLVTPIFEGSNFGALDDLKTPVIADPITGSTLSSAETWPGDLDDYCAVVAVMLDNSSPQEIVATRIRMITDITASSPSPGGDLTVDSAWNFPPESSPAETYGYYLVSRKVYNPLTVFGTEEISDIEKLPVAANRVFDPEVPESGDWMEYYKSGGFLYAQVNFETFGSVALGTDYPYYPTFLKVSNGLVHKVIEVTQTASEKYNLKLEKMFNPYSSPPDYDVDYPSNPLLTGTYNVTNVGSFGRIVRVDGTHLDKGWEFDSLELTRVRVFTAGGTYLGYITSVGNSLVATLNTAVPSSYLGDQSLVFFRRFNFQIGYDSNPIMLDYKIINDTDVDSVSTSGTPATINTSVRAYRQKFLNDLKTKYIPTVVRSTEFSSTTFPEQ